ncbi:MAG: hypothetical protein LBK59_09825 [Bifidobacteriaceae bacterium]|nr:hypothetical protein [Bifidobacteriaceae bacterium]
MPERRLLRHGNAVGVPGLPVGAGVSLAGAASLVVVDPDSNDISPVASSLGSELPDGEGMPGVEAVSPAALGLGSEAPDGEIVPGAVTVPRAAGVVGWMVVPGEEPDGKVEAGDASGPGATLLVPGAGRVDGGTGGGTGGGTVFSVAGEPGGATAVACGPLVGRIGSALRCHPLAGGTSGRDDGAECRSRAMSASMRRRQAVALTPPCADSLSGAPSAGAAGMADDSASS